MARSIELPGGSAILRDPSDLRERHRRQISAAIGPLAHVYAAVPTELLRKGAELTPEGAQARAESLPIINAAMTRRDRLAMAELQDAVICALLQSWTLNLPLPDVDTVQDLSPELFDALSAAVSGDQEAVIGRIAGANFEPQPPDRDSPFVESAGSATSSKAGVKRSRSTRKPPPTGESSPTGEPSAA